MNIELRKYRWTEHAANAGLGPLLPPAFEDQQSRRLEAERQDAVRGLTGGTQVLVDLHEAVANPGRGEAPRQALDRKAEALRRELPPSAWRYLEPLRPLTESVVEPMEEQRREAGLAELSGALAGQKAALRQLARIGAPLPTLLGVARDLLDRLQAGGLLLGERTVMETSWAEELAANRLAGRLERLGDAPLSAQPEAAYLSPEALRQLEELQRRQQAAEQEQRLDATLESAVGRVTGGGQATPEQAAEIEQALPGWSEAAGREVETWQRRRDSLAALLGEKPILGRLKAMNDGLYRRLVVDEQRRLGLPEDQIRVWDRAESDAAVAAWAELPPADEVPKHVRGKAVVDYARQHLASLPADLAMLAIEELRRRGLSDAEANQLAGIERDLAAGRDLAAIRSASADAIATPEDGFAAEATKMREADAQAAWDALPTSEQVAAIPPSPGYWTERDERARPTQETSDRDAAFVNDLRQSTGDLEAELYAGFEAATGWRARPQGEDFMVFFDPEGRALPLPKQVADLVAAEPALAVERLTNWHQALSGDLEGEALIQALRASGLLRGTMRFAGRGKLRQVPDEALLRILAAARAQIAAGVDPMKVTASLAPLLFEDLLSDQAWGDFFRDLIPIYGQLRAGQRFVEAVSKGDLATATLELAGLAPDLGAVWLAAKAGRRLEGALPSAAPDAASTAAHPPIHPQPRERGADLHDAEPQQPGTDGPEPSGSDGPNAGHSIEDAEFGETFAEVRRMFAFFQELGARRGKSIPFRGMMRPEDLDRLKDNKEAMEALFGAYRKAVGEVAEAVVRPWAERMLRAEGFEPFPNSMKIAFHGVEPFNVDIVALRQGAMPIDPATLPPEELLSIEIDGNWVSFRASDVDLSDSKFGTGKFNDEQRTADVAMRRAGHAGIRKLNPTFEMVKDKLIDAFGRSPSFRVHGVTISRQRLTDLAAALPPGKNTLASIVFLLVMLSMIEQRIEAGEGGAVL